MAPLIESQGNIILTDKDYNIITLLRTYKYKESDVLVAVNRKYAVEDAQQQQQITAEDVEKALEDCRNPPTTSMKQLLSTTFGASSL